MNLANKKVSILIPARNEEKVLSRLLESVARLNHDQFNVEVLLGNDASTDSTGDIIDTFAAEHKFCKVINLDDDHQSELKGKTRMLSHLIKASEGDYLLFTDADMLLPQNWVKGMLEPFESNSKMGVTVGISRMPDEDLFSKMQSMEWLTVLCFSRALSLLSLPTTGMGNNMAVSREAYNATGGYEKIGFSIVEDYVLYQSIIAKGYEFEQLLHKGVEGITLPPENFLAQRNRWISGVFETKSKFLIPAIAQSFALPVYLLMAFFISAKLSLGLWLTVAFITFCILFIGERQSGIRTHYELTLLFSLYIPISWFVQIIYYLRNRNAVVWKQRTYSQVT